MSYAVGFEANHTFRLSSLIRHKMFQNNSGDIAHCPLQLLAPFVISAIIIVNIIMLLADL